MNAADRFFHQRRTDRIMARVDAWAEEYAGWDCRSEAEAEVEFCLTDVLCCAAGMTDDQIVASAIAAWEAAT